MRWFTGDGAHRVQSRSAGNIASAYAHDRRYAIFTWACWPRWFDRAVRRNGAHRRIGCDWRDRRGWRIGFSGRSRRTRGFRFDG